MPEADTLHKQREFLQAFRQATRYRIQQETEVTNHITSELVTIEQILQTNKTASENERDRSILANDQRYQITRKNADSKLSNARSSAKTSLQGKETYAHTLHKDDTKTAENNLAQVKQVANTRFETKEKELENRRTAALKAASETLVKTRTTTDDILKESETTAKKDYDKNIQNLKTSFLSVEKEIGREKTAVTTVLNKPEISLIPIALSYLLHKTYDPKLIPGKTNESNPKEVAIRNRTLAEGAATQTIETAEALERWQTRRQLVWNWLIWITVIMVLFSLIALAIGNGKKQDENR